MSSCCKCDHYKAYLKGLLLLMNEITTILICLYPLLDTSTYRQLQLISQTLLAMTGRITMLSIVAGQGKEEATVLSNAFSQKIFSGIHFTGR